LLRTCLKIESSFGRGWHQPMRFWMPQGVRCGPGLGYGLDWSQKLDASQEKAMLCMQSGRLRSWARSWIPSNLPQHPGQCPVRAADAACYLARGEDVARH